MYYNLFTYLHPEGRLRGFQILTMMNKAAINICVQVFYVDIGFVLFFHLVKYQGMLLLDQLKSMFSFVRIAHCKVAVAFCIPGSSE